MLTTQIWRFRTTVAIDVTEYVFDYHGRLIIRHTQWRHCMERFLHQWPVGGESTGDGEFHRWPVDSPHKETKRKWNGKSPRWLPNCHHKDVTSNGSWCIGIKGECPARFVSHLHEIFIYIWVVYSFCLFCCLFIIVTWWYMWCIVWQVGSKRKYRHVW